MTTLKAWIIIRNGNELRLVHRQPSLAPNEVAIAVIVKAPDPPRIVGSIEIELPDPPPVYATASVETFDDE